MVPVGRVHMRDHQPIHLEVKSGKNFTDRAGSFSYAIIVTLQDKDTLSGYGPHPAHQEVTKTLGGLTENLIAVDFET